MQIYQVDAFAAGLFQGNPAAVIPLAEWLPDDVMQRIAMENNLSETAFFIPAGRGLGPAGEGSDVAGKGLGSAEGGSEVAGRGLGSAEEGSDLAGRGLGSAGEGFDIRWFTPSVEVDLCGHATLASGHVLFEHLGHPGDSIIFHTRNAGDLQVLRGDAPGRYTLNFPDILAEPVDPGPLHILFEGLGLPEGEVAKGPYDYMIVLESQREVEGLRPDFWKLAAAPGRGIIVTAPGGEPGIDFVSRGFFPQSGIDEDPVTGSAHSMLVPYWASRLGKDRLRAVQLSARRGYLDCVLDRGRVYMTGSAHTFLKGEVYL